MADDKSKVRSYRIPIKCIACGLHFNIYTWISDWPKLYDPHCPECGSKFSTLILGREPLTGEIHEYVQATITPQEGTHA